MTTKTMAQNTAQDSRLPLFYQSLTPLSHQQHASHALQERMLHPFAQTANAIPLTVDEFALAQRHFPIVFAPGADGGAPLALLGLQEGENLFCDATGQWRKDIYVPAYVRRYPFMLARLAPDAKDLSLCFDDQSGLIIAGAEGNLFDGTDPSDTTKAVLSFCEQFEMAVQRTRAFLNEMAELDLLMDAEATIQEGDTPMMLRGFRMIDEKKIQELRGDQARKMVKSGAMGLIYAHFFSLGTLRDLYGLRQERAAAA
jgi:SapC